MLMNGGRSSRTRWAAERAAASACMKENLVPRDDSHFVVRYTSFATPGMRESLWLTGQETAAQHHIHRPL
eukprot:12885266-Prorocentrum_lima.AAC.1